MGGRIEGIDPSLRTNWLPDSIASCRVNTSLSPGSAASHSRVISASLRNIISIHRLIAQQAVSEINGFFSI